ncbi:enolase C-terminal domain-like protein [Candidatus Laterigemmans baculatus]|uniref:enolase C-terminal domain-like protein n=1 Tax=Candidatus Laterigemmans baculatus TaxID=2770505 RepID=UPI0013D9328E|nr:enolase C-terminal domain-like protein [Candidatus Laterigemmans baculatus]
MRIVRFSIYLLRLPLRHEIKHASAARSDSVNVLIACDLADGTRGWGEGVPRSYVTGETPVGVVEQLRATDLAAQWSDDCESWPDVIAMCDRFAPAAVREDPRGCYGNALRCAVELSVLDAFGQRFGEPVSRVTAHLASAANIATTLSTVRYSGAVTAASPRREATSAVKMRLYGFRDCKVKVAVGGDEAARLRRLRRWLGGRMVIRIDANEGWSADVAAKQIESLARYGIASVEQPVRHEEVDALAEIRKQVATPIMLDESLTGMQDAEQAVRTQTCDLFNIRLSKCGGYLHSLRLAAYAHQSGLGYQLGCHPGESPILSAAGRHWATTVRDVRFLEGSYDRHLLTRLLTHEDITFGYGGRAAALTRPGLGVSVDAKALRDLAEPQSVVEVL